MEIVALSRSPSLSQNYAVVLAEQTGPRHLPIVIGKNEAEAIAAGIERMVPNRPLTYDLFKNTLKTFNIHLKEVVINNLLDGIFYARLVCLKDGELIEIDSRTSDALALAVRFDSPIFTYEFILDAAGIVEEEQEEAQPARKPPRQRSSGSRRRSLTSYSDEALQRMLEEMLESEDYERAAEIRDEMQRRKDKS